MYYHGTPWFICLFFSIALQIRAQPYDAIINLGGDCQVAYQVYSTGLRQYALPFDKWITPYDSLQKILQSRFEAFLSPHNFTLMGTNTGEKYILDKKYGIRLIHDFTLQDDFLKDYAEFSTQYLRRIERFMYVIATSTYQLFIRKTITKDQALELRNLLLMLRNGRPFLLLALGNAGEMHHDWKLEMVRSYYLKQPEPYN